MVAYNSVAKLTCVDYLGPVRRRKFGAMAPRGANFPHLGETGSTGQWKLPKKGGPFCHHGLITCYGTVTPILRFADPRHRWQVT